MRKQERGKNLRKSQVDEQGVVWSGPRDAVDKREEEGAHKSCSQFC